SKVSAKSSSDKISALRREPSFTFGTPIGLWDTYVKDYGVLGPTSVNAFKYGNDAIDLNNARYLITIELGSQRQRLTVLPDPGSGLFWVLDSEACPNAVDREDHTVTEHHSASGRCGGKTAFQHGASATYQPVDRPWHQSYGHGGNGYWGTSGRDTVRDTNNSGPVLDKIHVDLVPGERLFWRFPIDSVSVGQSVVEGG
ncbi:hypothetical protein AAVH_19080, partial [Aphelenchoides avenae]